MSALISILAFYNHDATIFDNLQLPTDVDKDDIVNNILLEVGELELLYTNFDLMKASIGFWSKKELPVWNKLLATTKYNYNPLENFSRTENITDTETRNLTGSNNETRNLTGSDNETRNLTGGTARSGTDTDTSTNSGTDTLKDYVVAFNETEETPSLSNKKDNSLGSKNVLTKELNTNETMTDSGTVNKALTDSGTVNRALSDSGTVNRALTDNGTVTNTTVASYHGNIGIITTQKLIEQERNISMFNINNYIIDSFKKRFCILIY